MSPPPHPFNSWRRAVNNWAQETAKRVTYDTNPSGPPHAQRWNAMVYVDGIPALNAVKVASSKAGAEELAAEALYGIKDNF